jgi:hypothetical protein
MFKQNVPKNNLTDDEFYLIIEFLLTIFISVGFLDTAYADAAVTLLKRNRISIKSQNLISF